MGKLKDVMRRLGLGGPFGKAVIFAREGRIEEAIGCYRESLSRHPDSFAALYNMSILLGQIGLWEEAIDGLEKALRIDSGFAKAWFYQGCYLQEMNRLNEALQCLNRALEFDPANTRALAAKAVNLIAQSRYDEALRCIDGALENDSGSIELRAAKAEALVKAGRLAEAKPVLEGMLLEASSSSDIRKKLRAVCEKLANPAGPDPDFADESAARPLARADVLVKLAMELSETGLEDRALHYLDEAIRIERHHPDAWRNKGVILQGQRRYADALACYDEAVAADPDYAEAHCYRGECFSRLGLWPEAARALERAQELGCDAPHLDRNLTIARMRSG